MEKITFMSQTIDDFSTFFRISKKQETFNLLKSINDAIRLIVVQLKSKNIIINIETHNNTNLDVYGLVNEFRQVILNMIHNAMMAIVSIENDQGYININIEEKSKFINIGISDNGGGIKEENLTKIFDPYFTTKDQGSGIGLYMSKIIIEHHMKGTLMVKNSDHGAIFTIALKQTGKK
jgi:signal transduction histidine kinase